MITVAIVGVSIVAILASIYDLSARGISAQGDATDTPVPALGTRKMDFIVIGILAVALTFSIYLNLRGDSEEVSALDPVSILVADFDNRTGDLVFDGLLEQALTFGIKSAPHIASLERNLARRLAEEVQSGVDDLPVDSARLVAIQEAVGLVLAGAIEPAGRLSTGTDASRSSQR